MSETFKCCNCGFVCEIINAESLDMGVAECESCGMKGLRRHNSPVSFVDSFRKVITMLDPQANSLMSKDMPPTVKILADWGRKACDEVEQLQAKLAKAKAENEHLCDTVDAAQQELEDYLKGTLEEKLRDENKRLKDFARHVIRQECWALEDLDGFDVQKWAEKLKLIMPCIATEDDIDDLAYHEVGDTIYKFSELLDETGK